MARKGLGERIQTLRELAGLSARELGGLADLAPAHVRQIETGLSVRVEAQTVSQIASVFGATIDWLFNGAGEQPDDDVMRRAIARARRAKASRDAAERKTGTAG